MKIELGSRAFGSLALGFRAGPRGVLSSQSSGWWVQEGPLQREVGLGYDAKEMSLLFSDISSHF